MKENTRENQSNRLHEEAQKDPLVSLNQQGGNQAVSVPQKIPYHDASQPPNSKIPKQKRKHKDHASNRKTTRSHA